MLPGKLIKAILIKSLMINAAIDLYIYPAAMRIYRIYKNVYDFQMNVGNLNVLKFLHKYTKANCAYYTLNFAVMRGKLETVKWLYRNRPECNWLVLAYGYAINENQKEIADWLKFQMELNQGCLEDDTI